MISDFEKKTSKKCEYSREEIAQHLENLKLSGETTSSWSQENRIPRSTLRYWLDRQKKYGLSSDIIQFFESTQGLVVLHKIVVAALFVFTKVGVASLHNVSEFLELSSLSCFAGASYSSIQRYSQEMNQHIQEFGEEEIEELCQTMPFKRIALAEDETFHPEICMVSMEPVSNYILTETYVEKRDGKTWNQTVQPELDRFNVEVIQVASDEGKGLKHHILQGLGAHHSSDCFHVSYEISKGTSAALASKVKQAQKQEDLAQQKRKREEQKKESYEKKPSRGRRPHFEAKIEQAQQEVKQAQQNLRQVEQNQEEATQARKELTDSYHPFDLNTGKKQTPCAMQKHWDGCFQTLRKATCSLRETAQQKVEKAAKIIPNWIANLAFFFSMLEILLEEQDLSQSQKDLLQTTLIPATYLQKAASKERDLEKKRKIIRVSQELEETFHQQVELVFGKQHSLSGLIKLANHVANLFQRSSSCVEGRNAQLALRHQGVHRMNCQDLKVQTMSHNFHIKNKRGVTPAKDFFEQKHNNLFDSLLGRMSMPVRPRKHLDQVA